MLLLALAGAGQLQTTLHLAWPLGSSSRGVPQHCRKAQLAHLAHASWPLLVAHHPILTHCQLLATELQQALVA